MTRVFVLESRLAMGRHTFFLAGAIVAVAILAWTQEPIFLRVQGIQILWRGAAAFASGSFLVAAFVWTARAKERLGWARGGAALGTSWILASGAALLLQAILFHLFATLCGITLDSISGVGGLDRPPILAELVRSVGLAAPLAFLAPGLAFLHFSNAATLGLLCIAFGLSLAFPRPVTLDAVSQWANLVPTLLATLGSLGLAATFQRCNRT